VLDRYIYCQLALKVFSAYPTNIAVIMSMNCCCYYRQPFLPYDNSQLDFLLTFWHGNVSCRTFLLFFFILTCDCIRLLPK